MSEISIRSAVINDCQTLLHFITELAIYEKAEHEVLATEQSLKESIFAENSHVHGLICEYQGEAVGAVAQSEWVGYRLSGQALSDFVK